MQDQDQCLQSCCAHYFGLRLRGLDHILPPHQTPIAFPSALPLHHPHIHWSDFVTNVEVLEQAEVPSIEAMLLKCQLRWAGHVTRMEEHLLPKIIVYGELSAGHRDRGTPKKRYKNCLKKSPKSCNIDLHQLTTIAAERDGWRHTVHTAVKNVETFRCEALKEKRQQRKTRAAATLENPNPDQTFKCRHYPRAYLSRIGLVSHKRACSRRGRPS